MSSNDNPRTERTSEFFTFALVLLAALVGWLSFGDSLYDLANPEEARIRRAEAAEKKRLSEEFVTVRRAVPVDAPAKKASEAPAAPRAVVVGSADDRPAVRALRPTEIFPGEGKPLRTVR